MARLRTSRALATGFGVVLLVFAAAAQDKTPAAKPAHRANELTLAGLRPGVDKLDAAEKTLKPEQRSRSSRPETQEWADGCTGRFVRLELDRERVIESVTVSMLGSTQADCPVKPPAWLEPQRLRTGRGIALGSTKSRVLALYGPPQSSGPSAHMGRELELLFYAFDWAGADVPQVMEITIERGRVVQITLAFPGL